MPNDKPMSIARMIQQWGPVAGIGVALVVQWVTMQSNIDKNTEAIIRMDDEGTKWLRAYVEERHKEELTEAREEASIEARLKRLEDDISEIKGDVKSLLGNWWNE